MEPLAPHDPAAVGPYQLVGRLGVGGMGQVYLGRDGAGESVAVKVLHPQYMADPTFRVRFAREVTVARAVNHRWIARVLGADADAPVPWLATEYVAGPTLEQEVRAGGPLPEQAVLSMAATLAEALVVLHAAGVVHRDLKPSNVLLDADGPKLIDFGIARAIDATALTHTGAVLGAPGFMSPEQALGEQAEASSDVFSLAAVLVYAALGRGPFGQTASAVAMLRRVADQPPELAGLSDGLRALVEPCLAKDPGARPTAEQLVVQLTGVPGPTTPSPPSPAAPAAAGVSVPEPQVVVPPPRPPLLLNRRKVLVGLGVVGAIGVGGLGLAVATGVLGDERRPRWSFRPRGRILRLVPDGETLYVLTGDIPGSFGTALYALNTTTGQPRWNRADLFTQVLLLTDGGCILGDGTLGSMALDAGTGELRWRNDSFTAAAVSSGMVIGGWRKSLDEFRSRGEEPFAPDAERYFVAALDPTSGETVWRVSPPRMRQGFRTHVEAAHYSCATDGRVHVQLAPVEGAPHTTPDQLSTFDATTGAVRWTLPLPFLAPELIATPTGLFGLQSTGGQQGELFSVVPGTGQEGWRRALPHDGVRVWSAVTATAESVYLSTKNGARPYLEVWDTNTGQPRWSAAPQSFKDFGPVSPTAVAGAACYVVESAFVAADTDDDYRIAARSTRDGDLLWSTPLEISSRSRADFFLEASSDTLFLGVDSTDLTEVHAFEIN
jgi:outer membrane protein assembly factor BamB